MLPEAPNEALERNAAKSAAPRTFSVGCLQILLRELFAEGYFAIANVLLATFFAAQIAHAGSVVGDRTPDSCTQAALTTALAGGVNIRPVAQIG